MRLSINVFFGLTTTVSASKATGSSMYSMPGLRALLHLGLEDRPRGVRDVGLAAAELLEAAAGAGDADGDLDRVLLGLLELLGHRFGDRKDGAEPSTLTSAPWASADDDYGRRDGASRDLSVGMARMSSFLRFFSWGWQRYSPSCYSHVNAR